MSKLTISRYCPIKDHIKFLLAHQLCRGKNRPIFFVKDFFSFQSRFMKKFSSPHYDKRDKLRRGEWGGGGGAVRWAGLRDYTQSKSEG